LTLTTDKNNSQVVLQIEVVEPQSEEPYGWYCDHHDDGTIGAEMSYHIRVKPTDVSFTAVKVRKVSNNATNFDGYFLSFPKTHYTNPTPAHLVLPGNVCDDCVNCWVTGNVTAGFIIWSVPVQWQVSSGDDWDDNKPIKTLPDRIMKFEIKADMTVILSKQGAWLSRKLNDSTIETY
jgi:hypothetical protein